MKNFNSSNHPGLYDPRYEHDSCGVGFLCNIKGEKSNAIVKQGIEILRRLAHRGATGADPLTGDGAGILIQMPHEFFGKVCKKEGIKLPEPGDYATGLVFLPKDTKDYEFCKKTFSDIVKKEGLKLLGWRKVPVNSSIIGKTAKETEPAIEQPFIEKGKGIKDELEFERKLYVTRRKIENTIRSSEIRQKSYFYITNLSCRTFSYKGLLMPTQVEEYFLDLKNDSIKAAICLVHSRYSTNTFPTWDLAQPFRYLAHNGEINTLRGNINWMRAKENLLESRLFGDEINSIKPIILEGGSDSACIDNVFELLHLTGRPLAHSMMMLIPPAWENNKLMDEDIRDFHKFYACLMEPWDGPAAIAFTDGKQVGAVLDRNGLRPARYIITKDDMVVMASEVGVLDIEPSNIKLSGRLEPGKMFYIDTETGRIIDDHELKKSFVNKQPYSQWLKENMIELSELPKASSRKMEPEETIRMLKAFGYTREDMRVVLKPKAKDGQEPIGSMGNDTPHAVLSKNPQLLYTYFKQLFAQVTNPAIDPIREDIIMSLKSYMGPRKNLLDESPEHCRKLRVQNPILTDEDIIKIKSIKEKGFKTKTISTLFSTPHPHPLPGGAREKENENSSSPLIGEERGEGGSPSNFMQALDRICMEAEQAIKENYTFILLSDRGVDKNHAALPALLATGAVHQHLVRKAVRSQIALIVESGEPREVNHFALLFAYGAGVVNPYMAYAGIERLVESGELKMDFETAMKNYNKALYKGIMKILSKMGISTLQSYRGAQIFEALGIHEEVINRCFTGTVTRIGGVGFNAIEKETIMRHKQAFPENDVDFPVLSTGGLYQWKKDGEFHLWNPESISLLQDAVRKNDVNKYREFAALINDQSKNPTTLRSLLKVTPHPHPLPGGAREKENENSSSPQRGEERSEGEQRNSIPIDEVEPVSGIVKRFAVGAMSFGSISRGAHETIAIAMNRLGAKSNTGEGGEDPVRFVKLGSGDSKRSAVKQIASGRFGVTTNYLTNADEIQIKIAQGAKPGEGGQLPGHKVNVTIARTRYTTAGVTLISPPPHHDIYSIEDLAQLIFDLKNTNPRARISVKLVSEIGVGTVAAGVAKGHADMILISGGDGGTGASPLSSIKNAGLPWELGLSETHQTLVMNNLRDRVRIQTDGQLRTGRDVAIAALLGAEEFGFATAVLITLGCVMLRHCHLNNCSLGVATQDEILQKRFAGKPEYVINFMNFVAQELREIMAELGFKKLDDMIGRTDLLEVNNDIVPWKAKKLDLSRLLYQPQGGTHYQSRQQEHGIDSVLDKKLIELSKDALENRKRVDINLQIKNINRTTGAMLSGEVCRLFGEGGLDEDTIHCKFTGVAGQSFGAWLAKGVSFELEGMANDYVGKGISGGRIIVYPDKKADFNSDENVIIGNTTFYGAISGEAYIRGVAGERFCIRNSGLYAVVEGVGDHGCEYMTGGVVVVLGKTGRNFGAGMSGGVAYVYNEDGGFNNKCNMNMVVFDRFNKEDELVIHNMIRDHIKYTGSTVAKAIYENLKSNMSKFIKVMPIEYKRILDAKKVEEEMDLSIITE